MALAGTRGTASRAATGRLLESLVRVDGILHDIAEDEGADALVRPFVLETLFDVFIPSDVRFGKHVFCSAFRFRNNLELMIIVRGDSLVELVTLELETHNFRENGETAFDFEKLHVMPSCMFFVFRIPVFYQVLGTAKEREPKKQFLQEKNRDFGERDMQKISIHSFAGNTKGRTEYAAFANMAGIKQQLLWQNHHPHY